MTPTTQMPSAPVDEATNVDAARNAVEQAINGNPGSSVEPIQALNAQPMGANLHGDLSAPAGLPQPDLTGMVNPSNLSAPQQPVTFEPTPSPQDANNPQTPPPVPPPMMPPTFPTPSH